MKDSTYTPLAYGPNSPKGLLCLFSDPPAIMLPVPDVRLDTTLKPVVRFATHTPLDRVSVWLGSSSLFGTVDPAVEVELRVGVVGGNTQTYATTAKSLSSMVANPFVFQAAGLSGTIFSLWARILPGGSPVSVSFAILADRSHCCVRHVIA